MLNYFCFICVIIILQNDNNFVLDDEDLYHHQMSESEATVAANCAEGLCDEIPATLRLGLKVENDTQIIQYDPLILKSYSLQVAFDSSFLSQFQSETQARTYIQAALVHGQAYYCHESLGTQLELAVEGDILSFPGFEIEAGYAGLSLVSQLRTVYGGQTDIFSMFCHDHQACDTPINPDGSCGQLRGIAGDIGTVCNPALDHKNIHINEKLSSTVETGKVNSYYIL